MADAVCAVSVSPLRAQSAHTSEMVSQLLFGDVVTIVQDEGFWQKVQVQYDGYEGWCTASHLMPLLKYDPRPAMYTGEWVNRMNLNDVPMYLPFGCDVSLFLHQGSIDVTTRFRYDGKFYELDQQKDFPENIAIISNLFLNTAYLWGGRSVFGIDCSGFTQLVFKMAGVKILRDARQQAEKGKAVSLNERNRGDLAFFNNEEGRVVHVGVLLERERIIHAAGKVRIDRFATDGIFRLDTGEQTHSFHSIRRYF